jgi:hypothetical protein
MLALRILELPFFYHLGRLEVKAAACGGGFTSSMIFILLLAL